MQVHTNIQPKQHTYHSLTILLVDDEQPQTQNIKAQLHRHGYTVRSLKHHEQVVVKVHHMQPDVIMVMLHQPDIDDIAICQRLKEQPETAHVPVLFFSDVKKTDVIVQAMNDGAADFVCQPYQFAEILVRLQSHMLNCQQKRQLEFQYEQVIAMRQRDRERNDQFEQIRTDFLNAAIHDLQLPLQLIAGYANMIKRFNAVRTDPELKDCVRHIANGSREMQKIVNNLNDMLDMLNTQSAMSLNFQQMDVGAFLQQQINPYISKAREKNIRVQLNVPTEPISIYMDSSLMKRALDNLMSNALQYSSEHTTIRVSVTVDEHNVTICIADEGIGIHPNDLPYLFEPFYKTSNGQQGQNHTQNGHKTTQSREHHGLGLAMVRQIVRQHQGDIDVQSEPGHGSQFSIRLPHRLNMGKVD